MSEFSKDSMLAALPLPLSGTGRIYALAAAVAESFGRQYEDAGAIAVYAAIDALPDVLLDRLAVDFKLDWWFPDATTDVKRNLLKSVWSVHRSLGTAGAVQRVISDAFAGATLQEWYDYGGQAYHYRLTADLGGKLMSDEDIEALLAAAKYFINLRSVLDKVTFVGGRSKTIYAGLALHTGSKTTLRVPGID